MMVHVSAEEAPMVIWTRPDVEASWTRCADPVVAMAMLVSRPETVACIQASNLDECRDRLRAMMLVLRRAGFDPAHVIVSTDHPSIDLLVPLAGDGVACFQVVDACGSRPEGTPEAAAALLARLCPALHCRSFDGRAASTCGRHRDRMLVGRQHMRRWCLGRFEDCSHWTV
jgi:hypothetical protein